MRQALLLISMVIALSSSAIADSKTSHVLFKAVTANPSTAEKFTFSQNGLSADYYLQKTAILTEKQCDLAQSKLIPDSIGPGPALDIPLTPEGRAILKKWSAENVGRQLAIIIDGQIVSVPRVVEPLDVPAVRISGIEADKINEIYGRFHTLK